MPFKLDLDSPIPLHAQIEDYLRKLISQEDYKNGEKLLPKEVTLSKRLGVSRNTIRQAINKLVIEGHLERKKGVGTKVVQKRISTRLDRWISFTKEMRNQGIDVVNYLVKTSVVLPDSQVSQSLSINIDKEVLKLEKIRGSKKAKYLYSVSYFHPRTEISDKDDFNVPLYDLLEKNHDIIVATSKERLSAIIANEELCTLLEIEKNTPVLKRERLVTDVGNRPVEFNIVYYRTEYFTYDIEIKRGFD
ncbi:GntR family transcriptional regulator [Flagellimonas sp. HMM57]|uniref:GntR family transcriptional regulator n=1 Tax=unclassified Flagellimonas TaxID=2644544 RepID=UPI0013D0D5CF|nr:MULTISPECIES: GntR family transcriptional regulator [unclassified Flagellimonas]UII74746.1 GntR family transcriptional regulator [Flagellimonas sp. HMM57]